MGASDFELVERFFSSRIASVSGAPYALGSIGTKWKPASIPLSTVEDATSLGHMLFNVWIESAPNTLLNRGRAAIEPDGTVWIDARVLVQFTYRLRPLSQIEDQRRAGHAAAAVIRAIMGAQTADEVDAYGCVNVQLSEGLRPALTPDGEWLLISQEYTAAFDLLVLPPDC